MVLLSFNDLNQGARKPMAALRATAQGSYKLCAILFHPDCDRRLWHRTRSADLARP